MARPLRIQYPDAVYRVMSHGNVNRIESAPGALQRSIEKLEDKLHY